MKLQAVALVLVMAVATCAGCARANSIYRKLDVSKGTGALIDIKQRAIISSVQETTESKGTTGPTTKTPRVCAEPSPDALSAYAAQLAAEGSPPLTAGRVS
jgi:hypothetical protein